MGQESFTERYNDWLQNIVKPICNEFNIPVWKYMKIMQDFQDWAPNETDNFVQHFFNISSH